MSDVIGVSNPQCPAHVTGPTDVVRGAVLDFVLVPGEECGDLVEPREVGCVERGCAGVAGCEVGVLAVDPANSPHAAGNTARTRRPTACLSDLVDRDLDRGTDSP